MSSAILNPHTELKVAIMTKRSQNKKFFTRGNYKQRVFVLTPCFFKYYEVLGEQQRGKEKGKIRLPLIRMVEFVTDGELDNKSNVLQICYVEEPRSQPVEMSNKVLLYVVASSTEEREEWITGIRMLSYERGARFQGLFHPGVWRKPGRYSCCDDINRRSNGCQRTTPYYPPDGPGVLSSLLPRSQTNGVNSAMAIADGATTVPNPSAVSAAPIVGAGGSVLSQAQSRTASGVPPSSVAVTGSGSSPQKAGGTPTQGKRAASGQRRSSSRKTASEAPAPNLAVSAWIAGGEAARR